MRTTYYLGKNQILAIHKYSIEQYGGAHGLRSEGMLLSAISRPQMSAFGEDAYKTLFEKVAALGHSLISNHPFIDGNKRVGFKAMLAMLKINGYIFKVSDDEAYNFVLAIAKGECDIPVMADWLRSHSVEVK